MDLSSEDRHNLLSKPGYQPHPTVNKNLSSRFYLPIGVNIACVLVLVASPVPYFIASFHHLLGNEKLLLVIVEREKFSIYLARAAEMDAAVQKPPLKTLNRERLDLGRDSSALFSFDEAKRMLAVCSSVKVVQYRSITGSLLLF